LRYLAPIGFGIVFGIILLISSVYAFALSASYSPLLAYLTSDSELHANSSKWLLPMFQDSAISLLLAAATILLYRKLLPRYPFNILAVALIQLPMTLYTLIANGLPSKFATLHDIAISIASLVLCSSVLMLYSVTIAYNKHCHSN
jgi:hypothetical protein